MWSMSNLSNRLAFGIYLQKIRYKSVTKCLQEIFKYTQNAIRYKFP